VTRHSADIAARVQELAALETALVSAHTADSPPAERELAAPPLPVDEKAIRRQAEKEALVGIPLFAFGRREQARRRAMATADERIRTERESAAHGHSEQQAHLDDEWRLLNANDPATVLEALEAAFEDNQVPAVPIDCDADSVAIVLLHPSAAQIPELKAAITPAGRPTVHKRSQTDRNTLHARSMASNILATIREALAVAPAIRHVTVLTVERSDAVGGVEMLRAVALTGFDREHVESFNWQLLDPLATIEAARPSQMHRRGRTGELVPLDLSDEPDIARVLVTCAARLGVQVDPRVNVPAGITPDIPEHHDEPPREAATATHQEPPAAAPSQDDRASAWSRFRTNPWWLQAIAWLIASPALASWWVWRRSWPVWGRLGAIGGIALLTLIALGSVGGSSASKAGATAPHSPSTTSGMTQPSTPSAATTTPASKKRKKRTRIQATAAADVFNPIEQDGYRDTVRVYFRTPTAAIDSVRVVNARGKVVRSVQLGRLSAHRLHAWRWDGRTTQGTVATPGAYQVRVVARRAGHASVAPAVVIDVRPLAPRVGHVGVSTSPFYPIEQDGYRDTTTISFTTNTDARVTIRVRGPHGGILRTVALGILSAHTPHSWTWDGRTIAGSMVTPGTYRLQVSAAYYGLRDASPWRVVKVKRKAAAPSNCTPGYSPCLVDHGGEDYDCAGGSGNGPYYTEPGVVYTVTGLDPYGLDANGNGLGCE
jgi:flagellar hook assembly protein FlgD